MVDNSLCERNIFVNNNAKDKGKSPKTKQGAKSLL